MYEPVMNWEWNIVEYFTNNERNTFYYCQLPDIIPLSCLNISLLSFPNNLCRNQVEVVLQGQS